MKRSYFSISLKRNFKLLPAVLLPLIAIGLVFAVICALAFVSINDSREKIPVNVGIVGKTGGSYLGMGIDVIKTYDTSKYEINFITLEKDEAIRKLKSNEITSCIIVPDRFVTDLVGGKNPHITYVANKNENYFGAQLIREIARAVSESIPPAEAGIYAMQQIAEENGFSDKEIRDFDVEMSLKNINFALNRTNYFSPEVLGVRDDLTSQEYYLCAVVFLLIMLWGVFCNNMLRPKSTAFTGYLKSKGIGSFRQTVSEYFAYFAVSFAVMTVLCVIVAAVLIYFPQNIIRFSDITIPGALVFSVKVIPALLLITAFQFMLYQLIDSVSGVILGQFMSAIILSYLAGCFYPIDFFPVSYQKIISFLPNGAGFAYIRQSFSGNISLFVFITTVIYGVLFFALSVAARKTRMERSGK